MKATEIRIGNLVMDGHEIVAVNSRMIHMLEANQADFEPIPITEECLLKFGFTSNKLRIGVYDLVVVLPNSAFYKECGFPCKYVHQLQNLYFALTGEELNTK